MEVLWSYMLLMAKEIFGSEPEILQIQCAK